MSPLQKNFRKKPKADVIFSDQDLLTRQTETLKPDSMKRFTIINALIWAAVILSVSFLARDLPNYKYFFLILVFASGVQISLLSSLSNKEKKTRC